jgi:hypothetical protein
MLRFLTALSLFLSGAAHAACGPFDYQVLPAQSIAVPGTRGSAPQAARALAWANAVSLDARNVHSDVGFVAAGDMGWQYASGDSSLSKANTLLEFHGYFSRLLGAKGADKSRAAVLDPTKSGYFEGIGIDSLRKYPDVENAEHIKVAVSRVFGDQAPRLLEEMARQNTRFDQYGLMFMSRPAYLDSKASPGIAAPCMAIAYGQDYFTNDVTPQDLAKANEGRSPRLTVEQYRDKFLTVAFGIALRSSIVDYAAAQAIKLADPATGKLSSTRFNIGGKVDCELVPSESFKLSAVRTRCGSQPNEKFHQANPVVREVAGRYRMVQLGFDLFHVDCKDSGSQTVAVSDGKVSWDQGKRLFADLAALGGADAGKVADEVKAAAEILVRLPPSDLEAARKTVLQASSSCASYLEGMAVTGAPQGPASGGEAN